MSAGFVCVRVGLLLLCLLVCLCGCGFYYVCFVSPGCVCAFLLVSMIVGLLVICPLLFRVVFVGFACACVGLMFLWLLVCWWCVCFVLCVY